MRKILVSICVVLFAVSCVKNPLTGKRTLAITDNENLFAESFAAYDEFISESYVVEDGRQAEMVERVGRKLQKAAEQWLSYEGAEDYLDNYEWEFHLVESDEVNAWCMPGGKIVVYTGILPYTKNEAGLAAVMGHELAHALLNHGQQQDSANILKTIGAIGVAVIASGESKNTREIAGAAYDAGSTLLGTLPFSRKHELEADEAGLILMAIAGYDPEEAVSFWERMSADNEGFNPEFLSTHPSDAKRVDNLQEMIYKAKVISGEVTE